MSESFVHLHVHTEYSMLDGASRLGDLVATCARDDQPAVAITDHGVLFGLVDFFHAARSGGVKPILGCELYQAEGSRTSQTRTIGGDRYYHLTALAQNDVGYQNLVKLSTRASLEGHWYKPRVDMELLEEHSEGLVILSGCLGGKVNQALMTGDEQAARQTLSDFKDIFGPDRYFVEQMDHGIPEQRANWPQLEKLARDMGLRTVITNDSHYTSREDAEAHDALLCIQTGSRLADENRFRFSGPEYYVRTAAEMWQQFGSVAPDALKATLDIAEMCDVELQFGLDLLPKFPCPDGLTEAEFLRVKVQEGAERFYGAPVPSAVQERIDYELRVIGEMGFPAYFLIVADLCDYAQGAGIRVGPGRGSAGGSVVAYCTGITQVDPLKHGLIFERFLNPSRNEMPDIDMDFDDRRRSDMIRYSAERYGEEQVAQVITFGTIKAKSAIRDAARVLDEPFQVGDNLTKMMPPAVQGRESPLAEAYEQSSELREAKDDPTYRKVLETAEKLEGLKRQHGIHAAAVIIGAKPLTETVPLLRTDKGEIVTQYEMKACESIGLLKMDFLGLRNLTVVSDAEKHVQNNRGVEVHLDDPEFLGEMDDPKVYEELAKGNTMGVFQLDSQGMQALVRKLKPTRFEDISALLALYRPGPLSMDMHLTYADRKNGLESVEFDHPDLQEILGETYGVCVSGETIVVDAESGERIRVKDAEGRAFLVQGAHGELGKVSHWVDNGVKDVVRLRTRSGREVVLTPDHRVLTPQGWRPAGELGPDDAVATPHRLHADGLPVSEAAVRTVAYLLADGSISTSSNVAFVNQDEALLEDFTACVAEAFPNCRVARYERERSVQLSVFDDGSGEYRRASSLLTSLRGDGLQGRNSATKFIPGWVFEATDEAIAAFLAAYWDCDGHVSPNFAHVKTISRELAAGLQDLLLRLGIQSRLSSYAQEDCRDGVAHQLHVYDGPAFAVVRQRLLTGKRDVPFTTVSRGGVYDRATVRAAASEGGVAELDLRDRWDRVESVEPAGRERVYDLTVEQTHSFVANGVVVHNCVYQEQVMKMATDLAGFSMSDADGLRKAVGKKKADLMASYAQQFVDGGVDNGYDRALMQHLWALIEKFAAYGFNKAHTVAYGVISYQTAWLKAHYPVEYMAALLTSVKSNKDTKPIYLNECRRMGIPVLPPDVNGSDNDFTPVGDEIRFGLSAVRGVGEGIVEGIVEARTSKGAFTDFRDFVDKVDASVLNKRTVEHLIKAGAFASMGHPRKGLLDVYEPMIDAALAQKKAEAAGQFSLFDALGGGEQSQDTVAVDDGLVIGEAEFGKSMLLAYEREMLGLYVSDHPLFGAERLLKSYTETDIGSLRQRNDGDKVTIAGVLTGMEKRFTKKGDTYLNGQVEDLTGAVPVVFWPTTYRAAHEVLQEDAVLVVTGRLEVQDEAVKMTADKVVAPDLSEVRGAPIVLTFAPAQCTHDALEGLGRILTSHAGHVPVLLRLPAPDGAVTTFQLADRFRVTRSTGLFGEIKAAFGPDAVRDDQGDRSFGDEGRDRGFRGQRTAS